MSAQDLITCIQYTTSNTAHQVVRHLYPSEKLLSTSGPEVPTDPRYSSLSNYSTFNFESILGMTVHYVILYFQMFIEEK